MLVVCITSVTVIKFYRIVILIVISFASVLFLLQFISIFQVQLDTVILKFQTLHHFFFVLRRLLIDGDSRAADFPEPDHLNTMKFSSQGGFLRQPVFDSSPVNVNGHPSNVDSNLLERFYYLLSETAWPSICRCLLEGKAFIDYSVCQVVFLIVNDKSILVIRIVKTTSRCCTYGYW